MLEVLGYLPNLVCRLHVLFVILLKLHQKFELAWRESLADQFDDFLHFCLDLFDKFVESDIVHFVDLSKVEKNVRKGLVFAIEDSHKEGE